MIAHLGGKMISIDVKNVIDPKEWMRKYRQKWLEKNKVSELCKIEEKI